MFNLSFDKQLTWILFSVFYLLLPLSAIADPSEKTIIGSYLSKDNGKGFYELEFLPDKKLIFKSQYKGIVQTENGAWSLDGNVVRVTLNKNVTEQDLFYNDKLRLSEYGKHLKYLPGLESKVKDSSLIFSAIRLYNKQGLAKLTDQGVIDPNYNQNNTFIGVGSVLIISLFVSALLGYRRPIWSVPIAVGIYCAIAIFFNDFNIFLIPFALLTALLSFLFSFGFQWFFSKYKGVKTDGRLRIISRLSSGAGGGNAEIVSRRDH